MNELGINDLIDVIFKNKIKIIVILILCAILGVVYTKFLITPLYRSNARVILGKIPETIQSENQSDTNNLADKSTKNKAQSNTVAAEKEQKENNIISSEEINVNIKLMSTYESLIKSDAVIEEVIKNLNLKLEELEKIKDNVKVEIDETSQIFDIKVTNKDSKKAEEIANEISKVFIEKAKEYYNAENVYILDYAKQQEKPYNVNAKLNILGFCVIGFTITVAVLEIKKTRRIY